METTARMRGSCRAATKLTAAGTRTKRRRDPSRRTFCSAGLRRQCLARDGVVCAEVARKLAVEHERAEGNQRVAEDAQRVPHVPATRENAAQQCEHEQD